jgi:HSP20 family protein
MADQKTNTPAGAGRHALARREDTMRVMTPFAMMQQFADEIDRLFDGVGFGRFGSAIGRGATRETGAWWPAVEVSHRNNDLIVRADLPGLKKEDVHVDVTDEAITIHGERHREHEEENAGIYRSERSYGGFTRTIPLPEGAMADQAKATFKDGVLEITLPAPSEETRRGRRLEISDAGQDQPKKSQEQKK